MFNCLHYFDFQRKLDFLSMSYVEQRFLAQILKSVRQCLEKYEAI